MSVSTFTGAKAIGTAIVTATTGSPTVDTTSRAGKTIYKYTGSGSITIATGGMAEMLVIGGGGAAGSDNAGGGAGGYVYDTSVFLPAGTLTVTVGAGGTSSESGSVSYVKNGNPSRLGSYVALGGGASGFDPQNNYSWRVGFDGGSGGGGYGNSYAGGSALLGQGNNGSNNSGGGGAGGTTPTNGAGGPGASNSITGTSVTYAGGGGGISQLGGAGGGGNSGATGQDGSANTGGGAGGSYTNGVTKNGGSGYVVVVV
jgi:hypothetical protein